MIDPKLYYLIVRSDYRAYNRSSSTFEFLNDATKFIRSDYKCDKDMLEDILYTIYKMRHIYLNDEVFVEGFKLMPEVFQRLDIEKELDSIKSNV